MRTASRPGNHFCSEDDSIRQFALDFERPSPLRFHSRRSISIFCFVQIVGRACGQVREQDLTTRLRNIGDDVAAVIPRSKHADFVSLRIEPRREIRYADAVHRGTATRARGSRPRACGFVSGRMSYFLRAASMSRAASSRWPRRFRRSKSDDAQTMFSSSSAIRRHCPAGGNYLAGLNVAHRGRNAGALPGAIPLIEMRGACLGQTPRVASMALKCGCVIRRCYFGNCVRIGRKGRRPPALSPGTSCTLCLRQVLRAVQSPPRESRPEPEQPARDDAFATGTFDLHFPRVQRDPSRLPQEQTTMIGSGALPLIASPPPLRPKPISPRQQSSAALRRHPYGLRDLRLSEAL